MPGETVKSVEVHEFRGTTPNGLTDAGKYSENGELTEGLGDLGNNDEEPNATACSDIVTPNVTDDVALYDFNGDNIDASVFNNLGAEKGGPGAVIITW